MNLNEENENKKIKDLVKKLTETEYRFCEEYLKCMSIPLAMAKIDFDEVNPGNRGKLIYTQPIVQEYLTLRKRQLRKVFITREDISLRALNLLDKCMGPMPVLDKKGHPTGEYTLDSKGATKVLEMLFKHKNMLSGDSFQNNQSQIPSINLAEDDLLKFEKMFNSEY